MGESHPPFTYSLVARSKQELATLKKSQKLSGIKGSTSCYSMI